MSKNVTFQIQIKTRNYEGDSPIIAKEISINSLGRFSKLASYINKNAKGEVWNWFGNGQGLPTTWDGNRYVLDTWRVINLLHENFGYKVEDINLIKEFFLRFTPNGCDGIESVKFFKVEELTDF